MIKNAKLSGYSFDVNTNIKLNFQICISVPLRENGWIFWILNIQTLNIQPLYHLSLNNLLDKVSEEQFFFLLGDLTLTYWIIMITIQSMNFWIQMYQTLFYHTFCRFWNLMQASESDLCYDSQKPNSISLSRFVLKFFKTLIIKW